MAKILCITWVDISNPLGVFIFVLLVILVKKVDGVSHACLGRPIARRINDV
jgi:hypothetical protein